MCIQILQYRTQPAFIALAEAERRAVFDEATKEITHMLDQNLLSSFTQSQQFIDWKLSQSACASRQDVRVALGGAMPKAGAKAAMSMWRSSIKLKIKLFTAESAQSSSVSA